ncbi:hypothetical protein AMECASPLE_032925 [Ameca splendens]|uniref:Uncharacterized protein n=1 Tax=Ameca splendens TaxID=208324 RepID=A0ABV1A237_9TELE
METGQETVVSVRTLCLVVSPEEIRRITLQNIPSSVDELCLVALVPNLLVLYKAAIASSKKRSLSSILQCLQKEDTNQNRTAAPLGLPCYLSEDSSDIIRIWCTWRNP